MRSSRESRDARSTQRSHFISSFPLSPSGRRPARYREHSGGSCCAVRARFQQNRDDFFVSVARRRHRAELPKELRVSRDAPCATSMRCGNRAAVARSDSDISGLRRSRKRSGHDGSASGPRILAIIFERIVSFAASLARRDESCCRSSLGPVTNRCSFGISTSLARPLHSQHLTLRPAVSRSAEGLEQA